MLERSVRAFLLTFVVASAAAAQNTTEELARLREHLTLPDSTSIKLANSSALPANRPLKVYIATGLDMGVRNNFTKWLDEWNKKDGHKYGTVEIVNELAQADVILARYTVREKVTDRTETYSTPVPATVYDPATNSTVTRPVPRTSSISYSLVPAYAYVIARKPDALEILWRYTGQSSVQETTDSGKQLRDDFFKMLKARGKSPKN
jgi:hypothetical protein